MGEAVEEVIVHICDYDEEISAGNKNVISLPHQNQIMPTHLTNSLRLSSNTGTNPHSDWLPITASRNGNAFYSSFHAISSGIGFQALMLPVAFATLGWIWGIICLSLLFCWQFYTIWLMIQLHESVPGTRYDRYIKLSKAAFGEKLGKLLGIFPVMYLSGSITAVLFCTLLWSISISKSRPTDISYIPIKHRTDIGTSFSALNAIGIIAFTFRGHNLILEIQATMPTSEKITSCKPMWSGIKFAYLLIALCLFPLAIAGFWAYGNKIPTGVRGGMLYALHTFHQHDTSRIVLAIIVLLVLIHCVCSFQIYAMPTLDNLTFAYTSRKKKPCSKWIKVAFRVFFGCLTFFIAVAIPFLRGLAGLIGGIALPLTLAYPCFMWITIKKPKRFTAMWFINFALGSLGMILSILVSAGGIWNLVHPGIDVRFFKP
ncbi:Lysine histidine transporter-like [Thalictrum thalictroides]|uniref:Lysine histidine transporter-like n=1 Tax=Thalictrum thalictroides TaxID=46969 RepID=A0A7J6VWY4_THATH|nr:Lysine histidine transporter-like [Thalictrum thalictroides]